MNRKLLVRFTIPALVIGLSFFAACMISIRYIHRLQTDLAEVLAENVKSLEAAQEAQIRVRRAAAFITFFISSIPKRRKRSVCD